MWSLKIFVLLNLHFVFAENCSSATSCTECILLDESCYWCGGLASEKSISGCLRFNLDNIAELLCPHQWAHSKDTCSGYENKDNLDLIKSALLSNMNNKDKLPEILSNYILNSGKDYNSKEVDLSNPVDLLRTQPKGSDLKSLLHKLLVLKLLRKMKNKNTVLTEEEKNLLYRLSIKSKVTTLPIALTTTTTTTTSAPLTTENGKKKDELSELLKLLRYEAERRLHAANAEQQLELEGALSEERQRSKNKLSSPGGKATVEEIANEEKASLFPSEVISKPTNASITKVIQNSLVKNSSLTTTENSLITAHNHNEKVSVKYEEKTEESLPELPKAKIVKHGNNSVKTTLPTTMKSVTKILKTTSLPDEETYCRLFEGNDLCNSDHNCTWCNTLDTCIYRNKNSYKSCVKNVENMVDDEYGLDRCFKAKHCKECVQDDKCYWCDVSQRCHTYPFFGYVPNSCGGDWYVKQCDVQLAVIIVVLPLIIILLGMVTFYFCLKYCHYRQKVLRVPLFEKPGIFDYRKDKKVYFVNPEDESSDDELAKEKMRKKYRIPIEKEPLIDPNT